MTDQNNNSRCTRLYLVRHGDTIDELTKKVYKGTIDIPLSPLGVKRIKKTARYLSKAGLNVIYTSALSRAVKSGQIIAAHHSLSPCINSDFNEICFGQWEGLSFNEIEKKFPDIFGKWLEDPVSHTPPDGEPLKEAQKRIMTGLSGVLKEHRGSNIAIVSHAGVLKIIFSSFLSVPLPRMHVFAQEYGCVSIVDVYGDGNIVIRLLNHRPGADDAGTG